MRLALVLLIISLTLIGLDRIGFLAVPKGLVERGLSFRVGRSNFESQELQNLRKDNQELLSKIVDQKNLITENQALRIQLDAPRIKPSIKLLPAKVLGENFSFLIIDKGKNDGVRIGQNVVSKNILVGRVVAVSENRARVELPISPQSRISAKTEKGALGIVVGKGGGFLLEEVTVAETLERGDLVFTVGTATSEEKSSGFLPDFLIGEVQDISKDDQALFQQAKLKSPLSFPNLATVFLVLE